MIRQQRRHACHAVLARSFVMGSSQSQEEGPVSCRNASSARGEPRRPHSDWAPSIEGKGKRDAVNRR